MDWPSLTREFVTLFVVIDPIGTIPVYLYAVQGVPAQLHRRIALRAVLIAALVLLLFLVGGQFVLETLASGSARSRSRAASSCSCSP